MKKSFIIFLSAGLITAGSLSSCSKEIGSLNGASVDEISANPNAFELNSVVTGSEAGMRNQLGVYLDAVGVIGRDIFRLSGSEPRYSSELLGKNSVQLSNNVYYLNNPWNARYRVVKNCNILIDAANRSTKISDKEKKGYTGIAKTIKAYQLLLNLNYTESNGIRVDVADPSNPGPFLTYEQSLTEIAKLLDEGKTELAAGDILFSMSAGFNNGGGDLVKFNRALAARVAAYRKDWNGVLTALSESFYDITGSFTSGFYHVYSTGTNDQTNPAYFPANSTGEMRVVHPGFLPDLNAYNPADTRKSKARLRNAAASFDGLSSDYDLWLYTSNTAPIPIIRQEELVLLYAEAQANLLDFDEAVAGIDRIRTGNGGTAYAGPKTKDDLINEVLLQRRFSLLYEGHRWVDLRRYGKLDQLPKDRADDDVWVKMPRPLTEGN